MTGHGDPATATEPAATPLQRDGRGGRRRWLGVVAGLWAGTLLVAAAVSAHTGEATVREQQDLAHADTTVDRAIGEIATVADVPLLELSADLVDRGCRITPVRNGAVLRRTVQFATGTASGDAVLAAIGKALPARYQATTTRDAAGHVRLRADAGNFVGVDATTDAAGTVTATVTSGCRPLAPLTNTGSADRADDAAVTPVLTALDADQPQVAAADAPCPGGGTLQTVTARASTAGRDEPPLGPALAALAANADRVIDEPNVFAYRRGAVSVSIHRSDGRLTVTSTSGCP